MRRHQRDFGLDRRVLFLAGIAVVIGGISTVAAFVLLNLIHFFTNLFFFQTLSFADRSPATHTLGMAVVIVPVIGGLIVGLMARFGSDKIRGHGIPEAIEAILFGKSKMSAKVAVLKPLASGIVIGSGGPFGAEGPIIMTGGAIGSLIAQHFHVSAAERKTLLVAGATAGMTAVFGTPVAAVLLAVELLLFEWRPRSLLPVILACAVAGFARPLLLEPGPLFPLHTDPVGLSALLVCVVAGLLSGALSAAMSVALYWIEDRFHALPLHWMWWPALGGVAVGIGGYFEPRALGVGYDVIADLLNHHLAMSAVLALLAVKAIIWVIALGSGTSGGVLAPLLMLGAGLGTAIAYVVPGSDPTLWPLVCMAAVLAGVLGAPLTAAVFALGLTGDFNAFLPLLLATGISYGFTVLVMRRSIMTEKIARRGLHIYREYSVDPQERMFVEEVMTRDAVTIPASLSLDDIAAAYFGATQQHRAFPVCDTNGKLVGMLDRGALLAHLDRHEGTTPIGELLAPSTSLLAFSTETCQSIARRMAAHHVERLPVVADASSLQLIGIVSRSDLVKPAHTVFHEEHVRERLARR
ncbi:MULTISPECIES: chloride channel protein [unclassified Herbaspirillum]|uniref:chloride channel protein n=1 Tax=unclassified Herbaspirillum TaxID=2624150 RepID=UPI000E2FA9BC|nr:MULTISPECIES: chloride channel protein [unclassified Herbaspirillum]RFB68053.1 CBS domain-containing protein [Herbaspirillum sp. 3R-3a1]TFI06497.1 CBS domain-containing protein [Herbaspirillum sp. 3R11]TFI13891.1 CBS domain-containing protein [Herbaspirillum sp. 3R-11]TFI31036.1 CBS domain-containing protein [Herbaspirillum sp. 3C11]